MKIIYEAKEYSCSFNFSLYLISGKWKGLVIWHLYHKTLRYNELKRILGNITQKMLTQTLRTLEKDKLITRKVYPVIPPKVEYSLTKIGEELMPIFESLHDWGDKVGELIGEVEVCNFDK